MKKLILFAAILFAGVSVVKAEGEPEATNKQSGSTTLTVKLEAIQSITVTGEPTITYTTADHYGLGASSAEQVGHLSVVSAGGFAIRVKAENLSNGSDVIEAKTINVTATVGTQRGVGEVAGEGVGTPAPKGVKLSDGTTALISSDKGAIEQKYNVTYTGDKGFNYMKNYNADSNQEYTTTVTYTIAAK